METIFSFRLESESRAMEITSVRERYEHVARQVPLAENGLVSAKA